MGQPSEIEQLIALLAKLPGLGPRSARRAVLHMIRKRALVLLPLADLLSNVAQTARECLNCGNVATQELCALCTDQTRENGQLCIVEEVGDLWAMERSGVFKGRYHVLGGTLSALASIGPDELRIPKLLARIEAEAISEVILALNATVEGQTTAHYLVEALEGRAEVSLLAQGVPIGGELDYLDEGTITAAMKSRRKIVN